MNFKETTSYDLEDLMELIYLLTGCENEIVPDENHLIPEEYMQMVEQDLEEYLKETSRDLGFCRIYWQKKREFLRELGYDWKSPMEKFPNVHFD